MKKIKLMLMCGVVSAAVSGCNFLDIVPDDTATLADAFANENAAARFLSTCYSYQPNESNFRQSLGTMTAAEHISSSHWDGEWFPYYAITDGYNSANAPFPLGKYNAAASDTWQMMYQGIRQCYTFLENIESVAPAYTAPAEYERMKANWIGEAWFMIGYYHQLMFEKYGPIPVVEEYPADNTKRPRLPVDQVVEKICGFYDKAMETLPLATTDATNMGRASKLAAQSLKAKALTYLASPLFNGSQAPYSNLVGKEGEKLIPAYEKEKWKTAMDEVSKAITMAKSSEMGAYGGVRTLYNYYSSAADPITDRSDVAFLPENQRTAYLNCRYLMVDQNPGNNKETIWSYTRYTEADDPGVGIQTHAMPRWDGVTGARPYAATSTSLAIVKLFYTNNGLPAESDPNRGYTWDESGRMTVPAGANTANLHLNREPRFYAAVGYTGGVYEIGSSKERVLDLKRGGSEGWAKDGNTVNSDAYITGYMAKKHIHPGAQINSSGFSVVGYPLAIIRLAELYLLYAEACAEYYGSLDATAKGYIKEIHDRAGLNGNNVYYANYSGAELVKAIRREQMIELVFEGRWYNDLRRWLIADEWHNTGMFGSEGNNQATGHWGLNVLGRTNETFFTEQQTTSANGMNTTQKFVFDPRSHYLYPIKQTHLTVNDQLVQNPGY